MMPTTFENWPDASAPSNTVQSRSFAMPLPRQPLADAGENEDEWEYEYSSTETETFYLTLDLSHPSLPQSRKRIPLPRNGRGGYKSKWLNPGLAKQKRSLEPAPTYSVKSKDNDNNPAVDSADEAEADAEAEVEAEEDDDDPDAPGSPELTPYGEILDPALSSASDKIQILDLTSDNPLILYRDHLFSCTWSSNIGTELLFTKSDPSTTPALPTLRHLPASVDLLGALTARVVSHTASLAPALREASSTEASRTKGVLMETIGKGASAARVEQARFLEQLMALKKERKEPDRVTVVSQKRLRLQGWAAMVREKRAEEREALKRVVKAGGRQAEEAKKRLEVMKREDEEMEQAVREGERRGNARGRPRPPPVIVYDDHGRAIKKRKRRNGTAVVRESIGKEAQGGGLVHKQAMAGRSENFADATPEVEVEMEEDEDAEEDAEAEAEMDDMAMDDARMDAGDYDEDDDDDEDDEDDDQGDDDE